MNPAFRLRGLAAALWLPLSVLATTASDAAGAAKFVVKFAADDGTILIPGESAEPGREGWIDAHAFGQSLDRPAGQAFVGSSGFTFQKSLDAASPYLALAAMKGRTIPSVVIEYLGTDGGGGGHAPVSVELNHVRITGCQTGSGRYHPLGEAGGAPPGEQVTLAWSQVVLRYRSEEEETRAGFIAHPSTEHPAFDDDGDGIPNDVDSDDDNDLIADTYEVENDLNPFADDARGDLDGDKRTNFDEAVADTRANDGGDFFKIDSLLYRITPDGPQAVVTLSVKPGRAYTLKAATDPGAPRDSWFAVDHFEVPADGEAGPVEIVLSGPLVANAGRLFFAAEVDIAP
jgi:type VI secretion system Hcp family effector